MRLARLGGTGALLLLLLATALLLLVVVLLPPGGAGPLRLADAEADAEQQQQGAPLHDVAQPVDGRVRPAPDPPGAPCSASATAALHGNGTGAVAVPAPAGGGPRWRVGVVTVAAGKYRPMGLELLHSAATHFCGAACDLALLLLTSRVDDLDDAQLRPPARPDVRIRAARVPFREWPHSTLNKCADILAHLADDIAPLDFVLFLDADTRFVANVSLADVYGLLVGVEHPYYPRYHKGFCGRYGDAPSTNAHGFDKKGQWTFCQYPYDRNDRSAAHIDIALGKLPPTFDHGNTFYFQGALFGGTGPYFLYACESIHRATEADTNKGVTASFHDESQLNAFLLRHMDITRVLDSSYIYPEPPLDTQFNFEWLRAQQITPHIVHRVKDGSMLRHDL